MYLTNVQGEQIFQNNSPLLHFNGTNFVALTGNKQVDGTANTSIDALHAGNVIEIDSIQSWNASGNNKLEISNVQTRYISSSKCCCWFIYKY